MTTATATMEQNTRHTGELGPVPFIIAGASRRGDGLAARLIEAGHGSCVAVVDPVPERAARLRDHHGGPDCGTFGDIHAALSACPEAAVLVTSTDAHHAELAIPALEAGRHVFCEKPLETTAEKCAAIVEADRRAGGRTFVGMNLRYAPVYATVKELITSGRIGRILTMQADEFYGGGRTYFRRWNRFEAEGGGLWVTKATHDFDILNWLAGDARPLEVSAMDALTKFVPRADAPLQCRDCTLDCCDRVEKPHELAELHEDATGEPWDLCLYNSEKDTFDHGTAQLRFEGDILATYTCNVAIGAGRRLRVAGTLGAVDAQLGDDHVLFWERATGERERLPVPASTDGHGGADAGLMAGFYDFVCRGAEPKCRPDEGAEAVRIALAARRAAAEHRVVNLSEEGTS